MNEVNIISEGIAILILAIIHYSLKNIIKAKRLPRKWSNAILLYVVGLIVLKKDASCSEIADKLGGISHDEITRMLLEGKKAIGMITGTFINFCLSQTTGGFLIVDDFLIPKQFASKIGGVYRDYDHVDKKYLKGIRIVMILWSDGNIRIPIAWQLWHKEKKFQIGFCKKSKKPKYQHTGQCLLEIAGKILPYKTKNQIAQELLDKVIASKLKAKYLTFDCWYANVDNLKATGLPCYSRLKPNRTVYYQNQRYSLEELAKLFNDNSFNHKHDAYIRVVPDVYLPDFGTIKLLLVRKDKHPEPDKTKFLFSTDLSASAPEILLRYRSRWLIETLFRDLKQNFSVGLCQARSLEAQQNHISLAIFAFIILELQPTLDFDSTVATTIGEKKDLLSSLLLINSSDNFSLLHRSKHHSSLIPLTSSCFDRVSVSLNLAFKTLNN